MKTNLNSILDQILAKMNSIPIWYEINQQFDENQSKWNWNEIKLNLKQWNQIELKLKPNWDKIHRKSMKINENLAQNW